LLKQFYSTSGFYRGMTLRQSNWARCCESSRGSGVYTAG
jgi:hypothetical protein